jgi:imidazoleglycerol-phosphate dehydratase
MRKAEISRDTNETKIRLRLEIDGEGRSDVDSGCGFLDHMLTLLAKHAGFDLVLRCDGDTYVDDHHTVEDIGICLGRAFSEALGDRRGIRRYGHTVLPMDEALILSAVDISGRAFLAYDVDVPTEKVGMFDTELAEEFFAAFVRNSDITLHIKELSGKNSHHIIEGCFKSVARSLRTATEIDRRFSDQVPSTKGVIDGGDDADDGCSMSGDDLDMTRVYDAGDVRGDDRTAAAHSRDGYDEPDDLDDFVESERQLGLDDTRLPNGMKPEQKKKLSSTDELELDLRKKGLL